MLYQLSYEVKSVQVGGISELSLVPSISVCFYDLDFFVLVVQLAEHWTRKLKVRVRFPLRSSKRFSLPGVEANVFAFSI